MIEKKRIHVLLIDDEASLRQPLANYLKSYFDYEVVPVADHAEAFQALHSEHGAFDVALIDQNLISGPNGIEVMKQIKIEYPYIECIIFTGWGDIHKQTAQEAGAFHYIEKPFDNEVLAQLIRLAAQQARMSMISRDISNGMDILLAIRQILENAISLALADDAEVHLVDYQAKKVQRYSLSEPEIHETVMLKPEAEPFYATIAQGRVLSIPVLDKNNQVSCCMKHRDSGSFIGIPIPDANGVLCLYSEDLNHFEVGGMVALLKTLAGQAALVIHNAQAFSQIRTNAGYFKALVEATRELSTDRSLADQLQVAWHYVHHELKIDTFVIGVYEAHKPEIFFPLAYDHGKQIQLHPLSLEDPNDQMSISAYVIRHGQELSWQTSEEKSRICDECSIRSVRVGRACESCIYIPLKFGSETIGMASIQKYEPYGFSDMVLIAFRSLANQITVAIQNKRLLEMAEKRSNQNNALNQMVLEISQELSQVTLLEKIIQKAVDLLPAEGGAIYLLDESEQKLVQTAAVGKTHYRLGQKIQITQGLNHLILSSGEPQSIRDYYRWEGRDPSLDTFHLTAVAGAPIRMGRRILGTLVVDDSQRDKVFMPDDLILLTQFAAHAGLALSKAALMEKVEAMQKIAAAIVSDPEPTRLFNLICKAAMELFHVDHSGFVERSKTGEYGIVRGEYPVLNAIHERIPIKGIPMEEKLFESLEPVVIHDIDQEQDFLQEVHATLALHEIRSIMIVPVLYQGQVIGSFSLDSIGRFMQFSEQDIEFSKVFASHMAIAVENIRLMLMAVRHQSYITSLLEASRAVILSSEPDVILQKIVNETLRATGAWRVSIIMMDGDTPHVGAQVGYGDQAEYASNIRTGGVSQRVFQTNLPLFFDDLQQAGSQVNPVLIPQGVKSAACLPMSTEQHVLGVLWVHYAQYRDFTEFEQHALGIYANVAATSIEKARQYTSTRMRAEDLARLQTSAARLNIASGTSETLLSACRAAVQFIHADHSSIILFDKDTQWGTIRAEFPESGLIGKQFKIKDSCLEFHDLDIGQYFLLSKACEDSPTEMLQPILSEAGIRSALLLPILNSNQVQVGALEIGSREASRQFTDEDSEKCQIFASHVGIAIENTALFEKVQQSQKRYEALDQSTRRLRNLRIPDQLIKTILQEAMRLIHCDCGYFYENRRYLAELVLVASEGEADRIPETIPHSENLVGAAARTAEIQTLLVPDHAQSVWRERLRARAVIAIPLGNFGDVDAVFVLGRKENQSFSEQDHEIIYRFALQAAADLRALYSLGREQRINLQLNILQHISRYTSQATSNLEKTLHVVLTGLTADYGLRFNRAGLFLLDEHKYYLEGVNGIGQIEEEEAFHAWEGERVFGFAQYIDLLEHGGITSTPIGEKVRQIRIPARSAGFQSFFDQLCAQRVLLITNPSEFPEIKDIFTVFKPQTPVVVAPLIVENEPMGLIIADNKFTRAPVSPEIQEALLTYVSTASVAIYNSRLFRSIMESRQRIRAFFEASNQMIPSFYLQDVLNAIIRLAPRTIGADQIDILTIDSLGNKTWYMPDAFGSHCCPEHRIWLETKAMEVFGKNQPREFSFPVSLCDCQDVQIPMQGICCPLLIGRENLGVVWLYFNQSRSFSDDEKDSLQLYINHAVLTFDSSRRMRRMELLRQSAETLANLEAFPESDQLIMIVSKALEIFEASSVIVCPYDQEEQSFHPEAIQSSHILRSKLEPFTNPEVWQSISVIQAKDIGYLTVTDLAHAEALTGDLLMKAQASIGVQAFQAMNLKVGDESLGMLIIDYNRPRAFGTEDQYMLESFGFSAAMAIRRARLTFKADTYAASLSLVREKASRLAELLTQTNQEDVLPSIPLIIRDLLKCDMVNLYTYNEESGRFEEFVHSGSVREELVTPPERLGKPSTVWNVLMLPEPYYHWSKNLSEDPHLKGKFVKETGIQSAMGIQLRVMEEKVGVMFINYLTPHEFTPEDINNAMLFANQAAIIIKNIRMYNAIQQRAKSLEVLIEAGKAVSSSLSVDENLDQIARQAWEIMERKHARISGCYIVNAQAEGLALATMYPPQEKLAPLALSEANLKLDMESGMIERAYRMQKTQYLSNLADSPGSLGFFTDTHSKLSVPILYEARTLGIINLEHPSVGAFNASDIQAAEALAAQAALAIRNAQQYSDLQQIKGFVGSQTALAWMKQLTSAWGHSIKREVGIAGALTSMIKDTGHQDIADYIQKLENTLSQIQDIPITEPLSSEGVVRLVKLNHTIQEYLKPMLTHEPYDRVLWEFDYDPEIDRAYQVRASKAWLRQGMKILIENAIYAMQKEGTFTPARCKICTAIAHNKAVFSITNNGPEIPAHIRKMLFIEPIEKLAGEPGSGIGLMIAQTIFTSYQGTIELVNSKPGETTFSFSLPLIAVTTNGDGDEQAT